MFLPVFTIVSLEVFAKGPLVLFETAPWEDGLLAEGWISRLASPRCQGAGRPTAGCGVGESQLRQPVKVKKLLWGSYRLDFLCFFGG